MIALNLHIGLTFYLLFFNRNTSKRSGWSGQVAIWPNRLGVKRTGQDRERENTTRPRILDMGRENKCKTHNSCVSNYNGGREGGIVTMSDK